MVQEVIVVVGLLFSINILISPGVGIVVILKVVKLPQEGRVVVERLSACNDIYIHNLITFTVPEIVSVRKGLLI